MIRVILMGLCVVGCDDGATEATADVAILGGDAAADASLGGDTAIDGAAGDDLELEAEDFDCMLDWTPVRRFYITNKLGRLDETLAVANNPEGGTYPAGTVVQLVPQEAMVKRAPGWNPTTNDWEFFFLDIDAQGSVSIRTRGAEETQNAFGGNCFGCHAKAAPQWDLLCEQDHGCDPLPFGEQIIRNLQNADARCP